MLQNQIGEMDISLPQDVQQYFDTTDSTLVELDFPVLEYPTKITSLNLEKTPSFQGVLKGVKGQYLIFECGTVFNIRSNEGFVIQLEIQ